VQSTRKSMSSMTMVPIRASVRSGSTRALDVHCRPWSVTRASD
jgi:hypothetical protein